MKKVIAIVAALGWLITPANANETLYCQGMVCTTTPPDESKFANIDVKDEAGNTVTTIWGSVDYYEQPNIKTESNNSVCANCAVEIQPKPVIVPYVPVINETMTALMETTTVLTDTATATVETTTATSASTTFEVLYAQIMALLTEILALIAKLKG